MLHDETRKLLIEAWNKTHNAKEIAERFVEYLKTKLLPPLSEADIIAMDNMRSHHAKAVETATGQLKSNLSVFTPI
ncbi:MAG: hypothetical protein ACLRIL_06280 [Fusicatenibacter saccharivorans]